LEQHNLKDIDTRVIGLPDKFVEHGAPTILRELYGLSSAHIKEVIREQLHANQTTITEEINW
jgi:1-deoxy-D-xylulose-5-phosphate synthase